MAEFIDMMPPTLEDWLSQGPQAHPLPSHFVFSPDYEPPSDVEEEAFDEEVNFDD